MKSTLVRRIVALSSCLLIFFSMSIVPIEADSSISTEEMNILTNRSTESLLDEIMNGSYGAYFVTSSIPHMAYEYVRDKFEIFAEFESREDATEVLFARLDQLSSESDTESQYNRWFILELLSQPVYQADLQLDDLLFNCADTSYALYETTEESQGFYIINGLAYFTADEEGITLNKKPVTLLYTTMEHNDQDIADGELAIYEQCGLTSPISGYDAKYNCHSYAWYNRSFSNPYWINDICPYLTDPHYYEVTTSTAQVGDVVVYKSELSDTAHSAIIHSISMGSLMVPMITCESKMGANGVYRHDIRNVLDSYMNNGVVEFKIYRYSDTHTYTGAYSQYNTNYHKRHCAYCSDWTALAHLYRVTSYTSSNHTLTCNLCEQTKTDSHTLNAQTGECMTCGYSGTILMGSIDIPLEQQTDGCDHQDTND